MSKVIAVIAAAAFFAIAEPQLVRTVLKRNSNGYPIITTEGVEYSQCR